MVQAENQDREIVYYSAAVAIAAVFVVFVVSMTQENLLAQIIDSNLMVMALGTIALVRIACTTAIFFDKDRPAQARTFSSMFRKDKWLADRAEQCQPRFFKAFGAMLLFWQYSMMGALVLTTLFVGLHIMSRGQAMSMFVIGALLWAIAQTVGLCILLLRQMRWKRTGRPI